MSETEIGEAADQLYKAVKNKDKEALTKITSQYPLTIRLKIRDKYKSSYGQDLIEDFESKLSSDFKDLMIGLYTSIYEYDADQCKKAIRRVGTDEDTLIEIIGTRPNWMLNKVKEIYKNKYNAQLEQDVIDDTSGDFRKLLVSLLQCNRSENKIPDKEKAMEMAKDLFKGDKDKGKIKIDE